MKTNKAVSVGKLSEKEYNEFVLAFNACHKATDKKQATVNFLKKYNVNNFGTPVSICGQITRLENVEVSFENGDAIHFYAE